jgi:hypothetical protein
MYISFEFCADGDYICYGDVACLSASSCIWLIPGTELED